MGTKIDHLITHKVNDSFCAHTYIERKSPSEQENMIEPRNQSLRYISIDKLWPQGVKSVYGLNSIGLNIEFNEYSIGNKGLVIIEDKYKHIVNKNVEIYSIISDNNPINRKVDYSLDIGIHHVEGKADFTLYKEYGSLDCIIDSKFIDKCRIYQLS